MKGNRNSPRPQVGRRFVSGIGQWYSTLTGDWSKPPKKVPSNIKRLCIYSSDGFVGRDTDFLVSYPHLHEVRMSFDRPIDFSGLYQLTKLRDLFIQAGWFSRDVLPPLDLSRISTLHRFSSPFFAKIRGWESLEHLTELRLDHVYGMKQLDLSHHPGLETLALGPANGVEQVCLDGLTALRSLSLACMRNLTSITGTKFYDTVTELDIRGANKIPASTLARFRRLEKVLIGTKSAIMPTNFPLCSPRITPFPV